MLPDRVPLEEYSRIADALGCTSELVRALAVQESAEDPKALRCENHHWRKRRFASREGKAFDRVSNARSMDARWERFRAMDDVCRQDAMLNPAARNAAILCHSFGWCQIMGFNHRVCGYEDPRAFLAAMETIEGQRRAFIGFVKADAALHSAFRREDLRVIALHYNGPAYAKNKYDTKLAGHLTGLRRGGSAYA